MKSGPIWGTLLDTKGPEIRTAMLRDGKSIELDKDQDIIVEAVGDAYTTFEGYKDDKETRIGLSYAKLCSSISPGDRILLADGSVAITIQKILSPTEVLGSVVGSCSLGQRKNCNLPGVTLITTSDACCSFWIFYTVLVCTFVLSSILISRCWSQQC